MNNHITPDYVTSLRENEIFVFGCRRSGRHWEGAAAFALEILEQYSDKEMAYKVNHML